MPGARFACYARSACGRAKHLAIAARDNPRAVMNTARLICLVALACVSVIVAAPRLVLARPMRQLNDGVSLAVEAGFNTYVKENAWIPLRITLTNTGEPLEGEVEVVSTALAITERFAQPVWLGRNARRQVTLYVPARSDTLEVRLMSAGQVLATAVPTVRQLTATDRLVVVISDPADAYNVIGDVRAPSGAGSALAALRLEQLPDRVAALESADAIVIANVDTTLFTQAQRDALHQWVLGGGHLLLVGGPGAPLVLAGLAELAPGRATPELASADPSPLYDLAQPFARGPLLSRPQGLLSVSPLQPTARDARSLASAVETPLILRRELGRGVVDQLAFDPALLPLRNWPGQVALFTALLAGRVGLAGEIGVVRDQELFTWAAEALSAAGPPSPLLVLLFFALYVVTVGPLNFLVLRRLGRPEWAWLTIPTTVALFTVLGLLSGFRPRGNIPYVHRLSIALSDIQSDNARLFSVFGFFAPRNQQIKAEIGQALAQIIAEPRQTDEPSPAVTFIVGNPGQVTNLMLGNTVVRTLYAQGGGRLSTPAIETTLQFVPATEGAEAAIVGTVRNLSSARLRACVLIAGRDYQAIGDLAEGQTASVRLNLLAGHPHSLLPLRAINNTRERLTGETALFSRTIRGRVSQRASAKPTPRVWDMRYPFEQVAQPIGDALVHWQDFGDDLTRKEAQFGLVAAVLGADSIGPGVYLGCWEQNDASGLRVADADYTDQTLRLWRLPVAQHLASAGQPLPAEIFTWHVAATSGSVDLWNNGLTLQRGEHLLLLAPWFDLRTVSSNAQIALNLAFDTASSSTEGPARASAWLFNWQTRVFDQVATSLADISAQHVHTGPYLAPDGRILIKISVPSDSVTLSQLAPTVIPLK